MMVNGDGVWDGFRSGALNQEGFGKDRMLQDLLKMDPGKRFHLEVIYIEVLEYIDEIALNKSTVDRDTKMF